MSGFSEKINGLLAPPLYLWLPFICEVVLMNELHKTTAAVSATPGASNMADAHSRSVGNNQVYVCIYLFE